MLDGSPPARRWYRRNPRAQPFPIVVLAASLLLTLAATSFLAMSSRFRDESRLENAVGAARDRIENRLTAYLALLRSASALFAASEDVTAAEFASYVERLRIHQDYPGIQGVGYSARVPADQLSEFEAGTRSDLTTPFRIWPDSAREEHHAIVFLEPMEDGREGALGYDMFTDSTRREAMERARDEAAPRLSGPVTLVQGIEGTARAGVLLYVPVYEGRDIPATVGERRERLVGFVYAPLRSDALFSGIFGREVEPRVAFRVYDGRDTVPENLLHDSRRSGVVPAEGERVAAVNRIEVAGRIWTLTFTPTEAFHVGSLRWLIPVTFGVGLLVSLLLFGLARAQLRSRHRVVQLAEILQDQKEALQARYAEAQALNRELERTNAALKVAREDAVEANRTKADFLAAMSHELRTPLNAIAGYAELLEMGIHGPVTDAQKEALTRIDRSQRYLLALINDILNFARIEAGKVEYVIRPVPLSTLMMDLRAMTEPQVQAKELVADFDLADGELQVLGDAEKVQQILINLVSNAIKFTDPGGEIRVVAEPDQQDVRISVTDTGKGIPEEKLHTIFSPFVQVDRSATQSSQQGVGLGLAISRELARAMGGDLQVESRERIGSTFTLTLPKAEEF